VHKSRVLLAVVILAACNQRTAEEKLLKDIEPAISWVATLHFAAQQWSAGDVPGTYVRLTVDEAEKAFDKATTSIDQSQASKNLRDDVLRQIQISRAAAKRLQQSIEKEDRDSVAKCAEQFASASAVLQRLHQQESQ